MLLGPTELPSSTPSSPVSPYPPPPTPHPPPAPGASGPLARAFSNWSGPAQNSRPYSVSQSVYGPAGGPAGPTSTLDRSSARSPHPTPAPVLKILQRQPHHNSHFESLRQGLALSPNISLWVENLQPPSPLASFMEPWAPCHAGVAHHSACMVTTTGVWMGAEFSYCRRAAEQLLVANSQPLSPSA